MGMTECYYEFDSYVGFLKTWKITLPAIRNWCNENCSGYFMVELSGNSIKLSFLEIEDAVAFKLGWL